MKKYNLFYLICLIFVMISCDSEKVIDGTQEPLKPGEGEVVFGENLELDANEKSVTIIFDAAETWSISTTTSWLNIDKKNGAAGRQTITLEVGAYSDVYVNRTGEVNLKIGSNGLRSMKIVQTPTAKVMHLSTDVINYTYNKDAKEIIATVKMISNFEWKVKSYPKWMSEPVITDLDKGIVTNLKDSTELKMTLILDELTVKALEDSIVFIDPKAGNPAPTVCKLNVKFEGMGLASITWEREAFQKTDPQEDLKFGPMFKGVSNGNDYVRYKNDNYSIPVGTKIPPKLDYLLFYVKTPVEFDYKTKEEAMKYFDVFALTSTVNNGFPDDGNISAPIKVELTDDFEYDKNPKFIRRYWKLSFEKDNESCLRRRYFMYVLPKGMREKMFVDGVFDRTNFELEGKAFTHCGGVISDPTFRVEGLTDVTYNVDIGGGLIIPQKGIGVYVGDGVSAKVDVYANDPYVLEESLAVHYNGNLINADNEWLDCSMSIDPNNSKHAVYKFTYKPKDIDKTMVKTLKIFFTGDSYPDGLAIQKELLVVYKADANSNIKKK